MTDRHRCADEESRFQRFGINRHIGVWIAGSQAEPPAVIMDRDADVIRVVEAHCGALREGSVLNGVPVRLYLLRGVVSSWRRGEPPSFANQNGGFVRLVVADERLHLPQFTRTERCGYSNSFVRISCTNAINKSAIADRLCRKRALQTCHQHAHAKSIDPCQREYEPAVII